MVPPYHSCPLVSCRSVVRVRLFFASADGPPFSSPPTAAGAGPFPLATVTGGYSHMQPRRVRPFRTLPSAVQNLRTIAPQHFTRRMAGLASHGRRITAAPGSGQIRGPASRTGASSAPGASVVEAEQNRRSGGKSCRKDRVKTRGLGARTHGPFPMSQGGRRKKWFGPKVTCHLPAVPPGDLRLPAVFAELGPRLGQLRLRVHRP